MLNLLILVQLGLLDLPVLYLSRSIIRTKADYYRLLLAVTKEGNWEEWIAYMLRAVADTAVEAGIAKRQTASVYLKALESIGVLKEVKVGREKLFIHPAFVKLLTSDDHPVLQYAY